MKELIEAAKGLNKEFPSLPLKGVIKLLKEVSQENPESTTEEILDYVYKLIEICQVCNKTGLSPEEVIGENTYPQEPEDWSE